MTTYGAFENQAGVMAQRPPIFKHVWSLLVDLADEAVVSKRHLELALVTVSLLNKCTYCVSHHAPKLAIQGVSEQGAERHRVALWTMAACLLFGSAATITLPPFPGKR